MLQCIQFGFVKTMNLCSFFIYYRNVVLVFVWLRVSVLGGHYPWLSHLGSFTALVARPWVKSISEMKGDKSLFTRSLFCFSLILSLVLVYSVLVR